jgi:hypothetical protein
MKLIVLILPFFLIGCSTTTGVPIQPKFPDAFVVGDKKEIPKCPPLKEQGGDNIPITEFLKTIVHNYGLYYKCSDYVDGWNNWYTEQKKIYEKVKK